MTFITNQRGIIYQKDLGEETDRLVEEARIAQQQAIEIARQEPRGDPIPHDPGAAETGSPRFVAAGIYRPHEPWYAAAQ